MNARLLLNVLFGLLLACPLAVLQAADATLLKKSGSVTISKDGGPAREINEGDAIPQGYTVSTGPGAEAHIKPLDGAVATLKANGSLTVGSSAAATLEIRKGSLVSTIDPKKSLNYTVKTPKGLAAAKGTAFTVDVSTEGVSIATTADSVTFTPAGGAAFVIRAGMISITPAGATTPSLPVPLAQAVASNPEIAQVIQAAVQTVASVVQNNLGGLSAESATNLAAQVASAASAALPSEANTFAGQLAAAMTAPNAPTAGSPGAATAAVAAITAAAAQAAPAQAAQIAAAAAQAAPAQAAAAAAAATQAVPQSGQLITQQVAQTTGQSAASLQNQIAQVAQTINSTVSQTLQVTQKIVAPPPPATPPTTTPAPTPPSTPPVDPSVRPTSPSS